MSEPRTTRRSWRAKVAAAIVAAGGIVGGYLMMPDRDGDTTFKSRPDIKTDRKEVGMPSMPTVGREARSRREIAMPTVRTAPTPVVPIAAFGDPSKRSIAIALPKIASGDQDGGSVTTPVVDRSESSSDIVNVPNVRARTTSAASVVVPRVDQTSRAGRLTRSRAMLQLGSQLAADDALGGRRLIERAARSMPMIVGASTYAGPLAHPGSIERANQLVIDGNVRVVRFGSGDDDADAVKMIEKSDRDVLIVLMFDCLPDAIADVVPDEKIAGIIVGHAAAADYSTADFAVEAAKLDRVRQVLQAVTDAPVLLAVSLVNAHDTDPPLVNASVRAWCEAFDDLGSFDGFAVYNINRFPLLETRSLASIRSTLGLPDDRPVLLFELIGTDGDSDRIRSMWRNKAERIMHKIVDEGWAGIILYSRFDVEAKAYAVDQLMRYLPR
jgi:hypothetical protein